MIGAVRAWLISLISISLFLALAQTMIPAGSLRKIGGFIGGLLLIVALIRPILGVNLENLTPGLESWTEELEQRQAELESNQAGALESIIVRRTQAYIWDKAEKLGLTDEIQKIEIVTEMGTEGVPIPTKILISCISGKTYPELERFLSEELGIPAERQVWNGQE